VNSAILASSKLKLPTSPEDSSINPSSVILYGVFAVLLFAPLAFGAVEPWAIFVVEASAALLLVAWMRQQLSTDELKVRWNPLYGPMVAFAGVVGVQLIFGITAYWHDTFASALLYLAYGLLAFLVGQSLQRSSQAKVLAVAVTCYGVAFATFALLQSLSATTKLYWVRTPRSGGWIYGPYVNHNHYAGLMEMLVPIPLVMCQTRFAQGWISKAAIIAAAIMTGTIFLSGSRGGMLAFVVEMALLGAILLRSWRSPRATAGLGAFLAIVIGLLVWIGGGELSKRLQTIHAETKTELTGGTRAALNKDSLRMAAAKPLLGWGLGNFPVAYPQFRSFYTDLFVNAAHNDYLQLAVETGAAGFLTMLWFLWLLYRTALPKLTNWTEDINGSVALAALLGCTGILVHSFLDFNLQVPANAAWFYVLSVLATATIPLESRQRVRRERTRIPADLLNSERTPGNGGAV
jgi:O-antigen ligase